VEGAGNFPEFGVGRVEAMKFLGVHRKDISVRATVDEKQRHRGMGNGVGRIGLREIYVIVQACVEQAGRSWGDQEFYRTKVRGARTRRTCCKRHRER
jgi:hypothetical protein